MLTANILNCNENWIGLLLSNIIIIIIIIIVVVVFVFVAAAAVVVAILVEQHLFFVCYAYLNMNNRMCVHKISFSTNAISARSTQMHSAAKFEPIP